MGCAHRAMLVRMSTGAFGTDIRMLLCPRCGAPVVTPASGGPFRCGYCQAVGEVGPRDDRALGALGLSPDQEQARIQRLRLQLQSGPDADPYSIQITVADVAHVAKTPAPEFEKVWREAWGRALPLARESPTHVNQHRVYWLVQVLDTAAALGWDDALKRAVCETALEALPDPGYRQIFRQTLAGKALKSGDTVAAERWLSACDPAPAYVTLDTEYRVVASKVHMVRHNWQGVLALVGRVPGEVPIAPSLTPVCNLYRAHALFEMGFEQEAIAQFSAVAQAIPQYIDLMLKAGDWFGLCQKLRARVPPT